MSLKMIDREQMSKKLVKKLLTCDNQLNPDPDRSKAVHTPAIENATVPHFRAAQLQNTKLEKLKRIFCELPSDNFCWF